MIGELIPTGVTFGVGRNSINDMFSGTAEFNNIILDSGADFSGGTGGGAILSGGTDLYNIFGGGGGGTTTASNGLTKTGDNITLGGALTGDTAITNGANQLLIDAGGSGNIYLSGNSSNFGQIKFESLTNAAFPAFIQAGKGFASIKTTSGSTVDAKFEVSGGDEANMSASNFIGSFNITMNSDTNVFQIQDSIFFKGIDYAVNYHGGYTNRTLVDYEYVNNHVASATTGGGGSITGTGTTNTIARWDSISGLTDSQLTDDGANVSVYSEKIRRKSTHDFGTSGGTVNWDIDNSSNAKITLNSNLTLDISNVEDGDFGTFKIIQDGVGSHTITLGTGTHIVVNGGGGSISITATPGAKDIISFSYDGSEFSWSVGNDYN